MLIRIQEVSLLIRIYITSCSTVGHCYFQKYSKLPLILNLLIVLLAYSDSALCRVYRVPAFHWFYCFFFPVQPSCSTAQLVQNFPPNIGTYIIQYSIYISIISLYDNISFSISSRSVRSFFWRMDRYRELCIAACRVINTADIGLW